jgi:methionyl-tRNA formyltransferase
MRITLFTANQNRHNYLINLLSGVCDELFVIQEARTIFPGILPGNQIVSKTMESYFQNVKNAENKIFPNSHIRIKNKTVNVLPLQAGDINKCSMEKLSDFLKSDIYLVFGSSYLKGELVDFLIKNKTLNIHMGISPYYRGASCNFWALYDGNPHLVGATIHMLSAGLDNGAILYHALSEHRDNTFEYTMSTVKSAFHSLVDRINDGSIFRIKPAPQTKEKQLRYSRRNEFNDDVVQLFMKKKINLKAMEFDLKLLKNPYFLKP